MKNKILFISLIIIFITCGCEKDTLKDIVVKETNETNIKHEEFKKEENIETESSQEDIVKNEPKEENKVKEQPKTEVVVEETKPLIDNSPDELSIDYQIHKGRIDCEDESSCMDISLPLQFKYKDLISNVFYLEVLTKNNQVSGYFIEYVFTQHKYDTKVDCETNGTNIKNDLNDKITSYECTDENILKLATSY